VSRNTKKYRLKLLKTSFFGLSQHTTMHSFTHTHIFIEKCLLFCYSLLATMSYFNISLVLYYYIYYQGLSFEEMDRSSLSLIDRLYTHQAIEFSIAY